MADDADYETCDGLKQQVMSLCPRRKEDKEDSPVIFSILEDERRFSAENDSMVKSCIKEKPDLGSVLGAETNQEALDMAVEVQESVGSVSVVEEVKQVYLSLEEANEEADILNCGTGGSEVKVTSSSSSAIDESQYLLEKELGSEAFLEVKKKHLLNELEFRYATILNESNSEVTVWDESHVTEEVTDLDSIKMHEVEKVADFGSLMPSTEMTELGDSFSASFEGKGGGSSSSEEVHIMVEKDSKHISQLQGFGGLGGCSLKVEVIDDTALIQAALVPEAGNGRGKKDRFSGSAKDTERKGKNNPKQEPEEKKGNNSRRRGKCMKNESDTGERQKNVTQTTATRIRCGENGTGAKRMYTRKALELLRYAKIAEQKKLWKKVYDGLDLVVAREYDGLANFKSQTHGHVNFATQPGFGKRVPGPGILGEGSSENVDLEVANMKNNKIETVNIVDPCCKHDNVSEYEEGNEDVDSDEDYACIQRPAFAVEGEPNFDSGPPEDGWEYLRRVRWEAAQIPKVKVAKIDRGKFSVEQSDYMPNIPDVAKCPENLLPLKQWEDAFLSDFSDLRLALSQFDACCASIHEENRSCQLPRNVVLEKFVSLGIEEIHSNHPFDCSSHETDTNTETSNTCFYLEKPNPEACTSKIPGNHPTLREIAGMSFVARASMLRKRIILADSLSSLSRNDCMWLFALCAAIDTPLDADTCAALRTLLRKCANLRAEKSELDDEAVMLNILVTVTGRYFGQLENEN